MGKPAETEELKEVSMFKVWLQEPRFKLGSNANRCYRRTCSTTVQVDHGNLNAFRSFDLALLRCHLPSATLCFLLVYLLSMCPNFISHL